MNLLKKIKQMKQWNYDKFKLIEIILISDIQNKY